MDSTDEKFMEQALALARKGYGFVDPNPLVGAVIVAEDRVVAGGYHEKYGELHAERNALADAASHGVDVRGLTMYVTLEPCSHYGKTPPCANAVAKAGIGRVVVGSLDPNPKVNGKGIQILRDAGIRVDVADGSVRADCERMNEAFFHFITTGSPFVIVKYAMSLDGKIAGKDNERMAISGPQSLARVHQDRSRYQAIVSGVGTVLADDPHLTARPTQAPGSNGIHQPLRVIMDTKLTTPLGSAVVRESAEDGLTLIATCSQDRARVSEYERAGCAVVTLAADPASGEVSIAALLSYLGERRIDSVYVEAGGRVIASFLCGGFAQKIEAFVAPKFVGEPSAPGPVMRPLGEDKLFSVGEPTYERYGNDILIEGRLDALSKEKSNVHRNH